ncbi:hypothetical protein SEVIR_7G305032v4 [Setaria viridis]
MLLSTRHGRRLDLPCRALQLPAADHSLFPPAGIFPVRSIRHSTAARRHPAPSAIRREFPSDPPVPSRSLPLPLPPRDTEHVLVMCRTRRRAPRRCPVKRQPPLTGRDHHRAPPPESGSLPLPPTSDRPRPDLAAAAWAGSIGAAPDQACRALSMRLAGTWGQRRRTAVMRHRTCRGFF